MLCSVENIIGGLMQSYTGRILHYLQSANSFRQLRKRALRFPLQYIIILILLSRLLNYPYVSL